MPKSPEKVVSLPKKVVSLPKTRPSLSCSTDYVSRSPIIHVKCMVFVAYVTFEFPFLLMITYPHAHSVACSAAFLYPHLAKT